MSQYHSAVSYGDEANEGQACVYSYCLAYDNFVLNVSTNNYGIFLCSRRQSSSH